MKIKKQKKSNHHSSALHLKEVKKMNVETCLGGIRPINGFPWSSVSNNKGNFPTNSKHLISKKAAKNSIQEKQIDALQTKKITGGLSLKPGGYPNNKGNFATVGKVVSKLQDKSINRQQQKEMIGGWDFSGKGKKYGSSSNNKGNFKSIQNTNKLKLQKKKIEEKHSAVLIGGFPFGSKKSPNNKGHFLPLQDDNSIRRKILSKQMPINKAQEITGSGIKRTGYTPGGSSQNNKGDFTTTTLTNKNINLVKKVIDEKMMQNISGGQRRTTSNTSGGKYNNKGNFTTNPNTTVKKLAVNRIPKQQAQELQGGKRRATGEPYSPTGINNKGNFKPTSKTTQQVLQKKQVGKEQASALAAGKRFPGLTPPNNKGDFKLHQKLNKKKKELELSKNLTGGRNQNTYSGRGANNKGNFTVAKGVKNKLQTKVIKRNNQKTLIGSIKPLKGWGWGAVSNNKGNSIVVKKKASHCLQANMINNEQAASISGSGGRTGLQAAKSKYNNKGNFSAVKKLVKKAVHPKTVKQLSGGAKLSGSPNNKGNFNNTKKSPSVTKKLSVKAIATQQMSPLNGGRSGGSINKIPNNKGNFTTPTKSTITKLQNKSISFSEQKEVKGAYGFVLPSPGTSGGRRNNKGNFSGQTKKR